MQRAAKAPAKTAAKAKAVIAEDSAKPAKAYKAAVNAANDPLPPAKRAAAKKAVKTAARKAPAKKAAAKKASKKAA